MEAEGAARASSRPAATRTADAGTTAARADADALRVFAEALVAMRKRTFLLGPGLIPRINAGRGWSRTASRPSAWSVHR